MAVGDILQDHASVANDALLTIAAAAAGEAVVHNLYAGAGVAWELYRTDGANAVLLMAGVGPLFGQVWHVQPTSGKYLQLKNKSGGAVYLGFDGVVTK